MPGFERKGNAPTRGPLLDETLPSRCLLLLPLLLQPLLHWNHSKRFEGRLNACISLKRSRC